MDVAPQHVVAPPADRALRADEGFSLIEVVVALFLIGIVAAGALLFFVRTMQNTSHLQRTQAATTVATQGMELVRSVNPRPATAVSASGLLLGRARADVEAVWATAATADKVQTLAAWDPLGSSGHTNDVLPLVRDVKVGDMTYKVTTLIGACYRPAVASAGNQSCTTPSFLGGVLMYRATVVVTWKAGDDAQCKAGVCSYRLSALVDPSEDASWNLSTKPVAYDDAATFVAGDVNMLFDILANDVITAFNSDPTTIVSAPTYGSYVQQKSGAKMGAITYTAPTDYSGPVQLTYKLRDAQGRPSNDAIATIAVLPKANDDPSTNPAGPALKVAPNDSLMLGVVSNDYGTKGDLTPKIVTSPSSSKGSVSVVNGDIRFTAAPGATPGTTTFTYSVRDGFAQDSAPATVTVTIVAPTPVAGSKVVFPDITANSSNATSLLLFRPLFPGVATANTEMVNISGLSAVGATPTTSIGSIAGTTKNPTYTQKGNTSGVYTFTFQLRDGATTNPAIHTGEIRVVPKANGIDYRYGGDGKQKTVSGTIPSINVPNAPVAGVNYRVVSKGSCGAVTVTDAMDGDITVTKPNGGDNWSCSFTYAMVLTVDGIDIVSSAPATVSVRK